MRGKTWAVALVVAACAGSCAFAVEILKFDFSPSPLTKILQEIETQRKTLRVSRCAVPPTADGRLDDAAWRTAGRLDLALGSGAAADTVVRVCYDDAAIYVGVECRGPGVAAAAASDTERDSAALWKTDHIEMWFTPVPGAPDYQFAIAVSGLIYDGTRSGGADGAAYDPEWSHAVVRSADGWTAEAAIPKTALRLQRWPAKIGCDVGRNGPGRPARSWAGRYGDTESGVLLLEGVPEEAQAAAEGSASVGSGLTVSLDRLYARPGDRWIEAALKVQGGPSVLSKLQLTAALFALGADKPAAQISTTPTAGQGRLLADLRSANLKSARLRVELREGDKSLAVSENLLTAQDAQTPLAAGTKIPIAIDPPAGVQVENYPVTFGVPFAVGTLWDAGRLRMVDEQGREIPCQKEITARWTPDGAIRWVRFDAAVSSKGKCFVEIDGPNAGTKPASTVTAVEQNGRITLDTGVARYVLGKGVSPIVEIHLGNAVIARSAGTRGLYVVDQKNRSGSASADGEKMEIEQAGPIAACVRFEGFYKTASGENLARHITRVEAFAGQPFAKITHTLVLVNDTNQVWLKDIGWELAVAPGAEPKAIFNTSRDDFGKTHAQPVQPGVAVWMLQDSHYRFGAGKSHFAVSQTAGGKATLAEGEECGDYALLLGQAGGLMMACKESARQHPKEFEVRSDRVVLKLFSGRAGEELDFRAQTLVKKWNLAEWVKKAVSDFQQKKAGADALDKVAKYASNACGWAKTHDLLFSPVTAAESAAQIARLNRDPVYAHTDPAWLCGSGAFGRIHPRDPKRFPLEEALIDGTLEVWQKRMNCEWGFYGFVDYNAGPVLEYTDAGIPHLYRYVRFTYSLRSDLWMQYARTGDRRARQLAEATNRAYLDNVYTHWDSKNRTAGLAVSGLGDEYPAAGAFPFYWEGTTATNLSSSSNLNQAAWFYYLTGSGRMKDDMLEYANGIKKFWTPAHAKRDWRQLMLMRLIMQCYEFTWDPALLALAEATADTFYDPESAVLLSKNRPYHDSTYKTQVDVAALLDAWRITGKERYHAMALKVSNHWWRKLLGEWPIFYFNPQGRIGQFLYDETGDASYPQGLLIQMRQAAIAYNLETGKAMAKLDGRIGAEDASFVFSGIPFAQEVVVRAGADKNPTTSWLAWDDFGADSRVYVKKGDTDTLIVDMRNRASEDELVAAGGAEISNVVEGRQGGGDLLFTDECGSGVSTLRVSKDAPAGCYEIKTGAYGQHFALARALIPMVLYAPGYWQPKPTLAPPARWYFNVPKSAKEPRIYFDGAARVYDPAGKPLSEKPLPNGWSALPCDRPGLWSFEPLSVRLVRVAGIPPFFAAGSARSYFEPAATWTSDAVPAVKPPSPGTKFIAGAGDPANKAIYLDGIRTFQFDGGVPRTDSDGTQFLPFAQGTIEFFMKPSWDVADLPDRTPTIVRMLADKDDWTLSYMKNSKAEGWMASHCLYAQFMVNGKGIPRPVTTRAYRRTVFEPERWVHVAWVWGTKDFAHIADYGRGRGAMLRLYVNGRAAQQYDYNSAKRFACYPPKGLLLLNVNTPRDVGTAYDELRVSDIVRYNEDFTPPAPGAAFALDEHTRALFHFNGDLKGESFGRQGELNGKFGTR